MRINRPPGQLPIDPAAPKRARGTTAPPDNKGESASVVSINKNADAGGELKAEIAQRLDEVRAQLAEGTYEINYAKLADSIVKSEWGE